MNLDTINLVYDIYPTTNIVINRVRGINKINFEKDLNNIFYYYVFHFP